MNVPVCDIFLHSMYDEKMILDVDIGRNSKPIYLGRGSILSLSLLVWIDIQVQLLEFAIQNVPANN
jgi:hypothetical protein